MLIFGRTGYTICLGLGLCPLSSKDKSLLYGCWKLREFERDKWPAATGWTHPV